MRPDPPKLTDAVKPVVNDRPLQQIGAGIDGSSGSRDAACLAMMIAGATGGGVMLVAVDTAPLIAVSPLPDWTEMRERAGNALRDVRESIAPGAQILVETDASAPRALDRVARREHQDLLVVGSSHLARQGRVRIGRRTRQLLRDAWCPVAVAPRGLCAGGPRELRTIGVGYDGGSEADEAMRLAGSLARTARALLRVRAVVDDRLPNVGWTPTGGPDPAEIWDEVLEPGLESMRERAERAASATRADASVEVNVGTPADELIELSREVDLLVIGSRRWGPTARPLLGRTGEPVMHGACCSVMVVPAVKHEVESQDHR